MIKRLLIILGLVLAPLLLGLLFTYDILKVNWVGTMQIQAAYQPQREPLPLPSGSVPIQGAAYVAGLDVPVNPTIADQASLDRGKAHYNVTCALCHGITGNGKGNFTPFLQKSPADNLLEGDPLEGSDGYIFMTITNGANGVMPPLKENLPTAAMRWDVVNYVRFLQKQGANK